MSGVESAANAAWLAGATALAVALPGTGVALLLLRRRLLAHPNERSSHSRPTPTGGGVALLLGLPVAAGLAVAAGADAVLVGLPVAGALLAGLLGIRDDVRPLRPRTKMFLLLLAAVPVIPAVLLPGTELPFGVWLPFGPLAIVLTAFWLVGFANAFNFMDGIDGIAGFCALLCGGLLAAVGIRAGDVEVAVLGALAAGGSLGFLPWNFPSARVFMGDAGSLPLGILLAAAGALAAHPPGPGATLPFPAMVLLTGPFVFDVTYTLIRRARAGRRLGEAHRDHLYQRLARAVDGHPPVTLLYAGYFLVTAALAWTYAGSGGPSQVLSLLVPLLAMLGFAAYVNRRAG